MLAWSSNDELSPPPANSTTATSLGWVLRAGGGVFLERGFPRRHGAAGAGKERTRTMDRNGCEARMREAGEVN